MPRLMPRPSPKLPRAGAATPARPRPGFTLTELLITLVLLAVVGGALIGTLGRQQRFYNHAGEAIEQRSQLRQAASILPADFRGLSSVGHDILAINSTSVRLLANIGSGVICNRPAALTNDTFELPPLSAARNAYTSWSSAPQPGDTVMIFDEGPLRGAEDDTWLRFTVAELTTHTTDYCPGANILIHPTADVGKARFRIRVALPGRSIKTDALGVVTTTPVAAIPPTVVSPGAVVRFVRPVEYALFQSGQDTKWYLGIREYRGGAWGSRQVVSGPYGTAGSTADAMSFRYFTRDGLSVPPTGNRTSVARIDMVIRGATAAKNDFSSSTGGQFADSLAVRVAVRNRQ